MATLTTNYDFSKPTVGGDADAWGTLLNANWDALDALLAGGSAIDGAVLTGADITATNLVASAGALTDVDVTGGDAAPASLSVDNQITEGVQTLSGTSPAVNPDNGGTIATWTLTAGVTHTPALTMESGQAITILVTAGAGSDITWSGITWINGAPEYKPSAVNVLEFFKVGATTYGILAGTT